MNRKLEKKLDIAFSKFIRARDTWISGHTRMGKCCSCRALKAYEQLDCGHFINRKWRTTRWDERNSHAQCQSCNRFGEGDSAGYALFMIDKYGKSVIELLQGLSRTTAKFSDFDGEMMLKDFKSRLSDIMKAQEI